MANMFGSPFLDKLGNKIYARLHRVHHAGPERLCEPERVQTELVGAPEFLAVAHIIFAQTFHVVDIEAYLVPESMGKKECVGPGLDSLVRIPAISPSDISPSQWPTKPAYGLQ